MKTDIHFWSYLVQFFAEWQMFQTKVVEEIKIHILCSVTFLRKSCRLWDNVGKYRGAGQGTDDNMAHARCMPDNWCYRHTIGICNTYYFSATPFVTRTRPTVTFIRTFLISLVFRRFIEINRIVIGYYFKANW